MNRVGPESNTFKKVFLPFAKTSGKVVSQGFTATALLTLGEFAQT